MSGFVGNDPHQVQMLGRHLLFGAQLLEELRGRLTGALFHSTWDGPDAHEARSEWASSNAPALGLTAELMRRMSIIAFVNANEQIEASQDGHGVFGEAPADGHGVFGEAPADGHGVFGEAPHGPLDDFLHFMHGLHFWSDIGDIGLTLVEQSVHALDHASPLLKFLRPAGAAVGVFGLALDGFALGGYIVEGDTGGVILMGLAVGLGGAALVVGLVATAPLTIAVAAGVGIVAAGISIAASYEPVRDWVGDRWDDAWEAGTGLVEGATEGFHETFDPLIEGAGNVVEGVGNLASDALNTGRGIFNAIF
ncbi:hypothetical protein F4553_007511 [Allocatelliglobosispora scoriae]|uniref:WXG100 family type VII secretion target n=1 Tax=Allocatelliglobosispora scoriae TaxID=643052 RepID=A0A841BY42_9ACTN|nr:hypothetical protein [Allocatelliglobosispora scoriae]MBB5874077.1 hypothetical protein [Allocatelliglobosispora scoriae]